MIQGGGGLRFALEASQSLRIAGYLIGQEFESNETVKADLLGLVDHSHAAATELFDDAIVRNGLADHLKPMRPEC